MNVLDLFRLDGKVALVTGCNRGIGRAMAVALAQAGADIVGVSSTLLPHGSAVETEVRGFGREFSGHTCDFGDRVALYQFIEVVESSHPRIDILVNNAGIIVRSPPERHQDEEWDRVMDVNLRTPFVLSREIGRGMIRRGAGKIIFTASLLSFQGGIRVPGYAASKGAIGQLTKALSNDWASYGVQVNAIAPGYIETDNTASLRADPEREAAIRNRIPAGRWGTPSDLQGATVFLASAASDYVNGTILPVDGGWLGR